MSDTSRRNLLKSIAAGSGAIIAGKSLPESWSRPVVDSVVLPAHAQTSGNTLTSTGVIAGLDVNSDSNTMMANQDGLLNSLIPSAHAASCSVEGKCASVNVNGSSGTLTVNGVGSSPFTLDATNTATGTVGGVPFKLTTNAENTTGTLAFQGDCAGYGVLLGINGKCSELPGGNIFAIGDTGPCGGIVFDITNGGLNGLEAAPADQGSAPWGCFGTAIGTSTAIGSGAGNTSAILGGCGDSPIAAELASNYAGGGCMGWYLPSRDELNLLYQQKNVVGGFASSFYWSSSETNANNAWFKEFDNGGQSNDDKGRSHRVRAVRGF